MEDYQVLIDHAWSLDPDIFSLFRKQFQKELDKRRPFIKEYQEIVSVYFPKGTDCASLVGKVNLMRALLPNKISNTKKPRTRHTGPWMTPIDTNHVDRSLNFHRWERND